MEVAAKTGATTEVLVSNYHYSTFSKYATHRITKTADSYPLQDSLGSPTLDLSFKRRYSGPEGGSSGENEGRWSSTRKSHFPRRTPASAQSSGTGGMESNRGQQQGHGNSSVGAEAQRVSDPLGATQPLSQSYRRRPSHAQFNRRNHRLAES